MNIICNIYTNVPTILSYNLLALLGVLKLAMLAYYSNDCFGIFTLSKSIIYANFSTPNRLSKFRLVLHMIVDCLCLLVKTCIILEILGYVKYNHTINTFIRSAKVAYFSILNLAYLTLLEVSVALK